VSTQDAAGLDLDALRELQEAMLSIVDKYYDAGVQTQREELEEDEEGVYDDIDVVLE
jgi:phage major head subunit gpT-like protein